MKYNPYNKIYKSTCDVCGTEVLVDSIGNGDKCPKCLWIKCSDSEEFPDRVMCPNLISLNKARKLYIEGKPFSPDIDDFIGGLDFYGEMEFTYQGINYGVTRSNGMIDFWIVNGKTVELFKDSIEFRDKAQINGKYLKDIWQEVKNVNWLQ